MDVTLNDYNLKDAFKTERCLLLLSGFYPRRNNKYQVFYLFSAFLNLFISYAQLFSMIIQIIQDWGDLQKLAEALLFTITHFTFLCKLGNFMHNKNNLINIENFIEEPIFYGFSQKQLSYLKGKLGICNIVAASFRIGCVVCIAFYLSVPYLDENKKSTLPLPGWLPYNTTKYYRSTVAFQGLSIYISAYNNSTIDILTWILITLAAGEFDILKENLQNIDFNADGNREKIKIYYKKCIYHYWAIVRLVNKIELMFSKGIFIQFVASVIVICFTSFQMMVVPVGIIEFLFLFLYFACMMMQVAMYCWYGHEVMITSDEIGKYFYMSNWYESDVKLRQNMIIFLEKVKKPVTLTAGKFVTLSLQTLTGIIRSSYSYFAVLQHIYKDV